MSKDEGKKDEMETAMGSMGLWQVKVVGLMAFLKFPVAWSLLGLVFMGAPMDHHCTGSNSTCYTSEGDYCTNWTYDRSVFKETIVSQWDLVCDRSQLVNVAQMTFMIGILFGSILFSIASDKWGRKKPLVLVGILQVVTGVMVAFVPWFLGFVILRFLQALAVGGSMTISFVLTMEVLNGRWRTIMATLSHFPFNFGVMIMSAIAYYTRQWRYFQLSISLPTIIIIFYWWLVPESPRWLVAVGKNKEALELLQQVAKINGNPIPEKIPENKSTDGKDGGGNKSSLLDLFKTPNMRKRTLVTLFNWTNCGLSFFGLEQYLSQTGGNIFVNVAISGAVMLPGIFVCMWTMDRFGRRPTLLAGQLVATACCLAIVLTPDSKDAEGWWRVSFALIAVAGIASSFTTLYLYSTELFPTVVRNTGLGSGSMCARIGSMVAPFAASLNSISTSAPPALFGTTCLISSALVFILPETLNTILPNTIEEGEMFPMGQIELTQNGTGKKNEATTET